MTSALRKVVGLDVRKVVSLERQLLLRSVSDLDAGRARCQDCRRTPLVGERIHRYADGRALCELCGRRRKEAPLDSELVRGSEHGGAVRLMKHAA